jgi:hypothetical protein
MGMKKVEVRMQNDELVIGNYVISNPEGVKGL